MAEKVKLVIWDLDETFWKGTLSEEGVQPIYKNIEIVKQLVDRGIMCSIVSKNDYSKAMNVLKEWNIDELFIFPQISWNPKGNIIKNLLEQCKLRAENVVFIDDNPSNLEEAKFYNKGLRVELPSFLDNNILEMECFKGKDDKNHSRLKQYKILEQRLKQSESYNSNEDFLRSSNIKINIKDDCKNVADRIYELVQRTNQLNYTKIRSELDELEKLYDDVDIETKYIEVSDNFGDYGIVGFYALKANELLHFVFSCRILGFGVEHYIYKKLGFPNLKIVGDITTDLDRDFANKVDWIKEGNDSNIDTTYNDNENILIIGGCDLSQMSLYLEQSYNVKSEFDVAINGHSIKTSETSQFINQLLLSEDEKKELLDNLAFFDKDVTFNSEIFSNKYNVVILSVVNDYIRGIYKHREKGFCIGYGGYFDREDCEKKLDDHTVKYLRDNFDFVGKEDVNSFENNLKTILSKINSKVILINGCDIDVSDWIGEERIQRNRDMNAVVDKIVSEYPNVELLDMRTIVTSKNSLVNDNRHYDRVTYYKMAEQLTKLCSMKMHKVTFLDKIFSIKKYIHGNRAKKIIRILGIKISLKI